MRAKIRIIVGSVAILTLAVPVLAHHSFAAEFDASNCRDFTGTLTKIEWENPHAYFYLDVKDATGKMTTWSFQTNAIIVLKRQGLERQAFIENIGKEVFVRGCLARNGRANYAAAGTLKLTDGQLRTVGQLVD